MKKRLISIVILLLIILPLFVFACRSFSIPNSCWADKPLNCISNEIIFNEGLIYFTIKNEANSDINLIKPEIKIKSQKCINYNTCIDLNFDKKCDINDVDLNKQNFIFKNNSEINYIINCNNKIKHTYSFIIFKWTLNENTKFNQSRIEIYHKKISLFEKINFTLLFIVLLPILILIYQILIKKNKIKINKYKIKLLIKILIIFIIIFLIIRFLLYNFSRFGIINC